MKKITNAHDRPLLLAATGAVVQPGDVIEVDDELAESLLDQPARWAIPKPTPTTRKSDESDAPKED